MTTETNLYDTVCATTKSLGLKQANKKHAKVLTHTQREQATKDGIKLQSLKDYEVFNSIFYASFYGLTKSRSKVSDTIEDLEDLTQQFTSCADFLTRLKECDVVDVDALRQEICAYANVVLQVNSIVFWCTNVLENIYARRTMSETQLQSARDACSVLCLTYDEEKSKVEWNKSADGFQV